MIEVKLEFGLQTKNIKQKNSASPLGKIVNNGEHGAWVFIPAEGRSFTFHQLQAIIALVAEENGWEY